MSITSCISSVFLLFTIHLSASNFSDMNYETFVEKQKKMLTNDSLNLSYIDEGKGDVVLLIHGVPTSSWIYRKCIDSLVAQGKRVIIPDLIGYGQSDKPKDSELYTYDKQATRLFDLMSSLRINSWTQVCHDMGSLVTWKMMDNMNSSKISTLIILNSILEKENFQPPMKFKKGFFGRSYSKIYCSRLGKGMIKTTLNNGMYKQKIDKVGLYGYVTPLKKTGHHALYYFFTHFEEAYLIIEKNQQRLSSFEGEIVFIHGIHDTILTIEQITALNINKDITIKRLENSGHYVQEQELCHVLKTVVTQ